MTFDQEQIKIFC